MTTNAIADKAMIQRALTAKANHLRLVAKPEEPVPHILDCIISRKVKGKIKLMSTEGAD